MTRAAGRSDGCQRCRAIRGALATGIVVVSVGVIAAPLWGRRPPAAATAASSPRPLTSPLRLAAPAEPMTSVLAAERPDVSGAARQASPSRAVARLRSAERSQGIAWKDEAADAQAWSRLQITELADEDMLAVWQPRYTVYRPLPAEPGDVSLAAGSGELWVATETEVGPLRDGVWGTPQRPPEVTKIFALALTDEGAWAFGLDGGAWRRRGSEWAAVPPPMIADLYDAAVRSASDITAVGFDYATEEGVIVNWNGSSLDRLATPDLHDVLLYAVAVAPGGEFWAGGCDYSDRPVLLRDHGSHAWSVGAEPDMAGCIYDLAFSRDGLGIAAAGTDLLMMEGAIWRPALVLPPEGRQWVRVVGTPAGPASVRGGGHVTGSANRVVPGGTAWAIAGNPTWRGYTGGSAPWYFDGYGWRPAAIDLRGMAAQTVPGEQAGAPSSYVDLATDGMIAYSVYRTAGTADAEGQAAILALEGGVVRLQHPLLDTSNVVAAAGGSTVWVGGRGAWPLVRHADAWYADAVERQPGEAHFAIEVIDMAAADAGWALGSEGDTSPVSGELVAWRWDGVGWRRVPLPSGVQMSTRLRASPDGSAWLASRSGQLWAHDGNDWRVVKAAPPVAYEVRSTAGGAPFDLALADGAVVGCLAANDGLYRYVDGSFRRVGQLPRGQVVDMELVDGADGWAIATDRLAAGSPASPTGVLLRIQNCQASELRLLLPQRLPNVLGTVRDVDWWLMSPTSTRELWLAGIATGPWLYAPLLAAVTSEPDASSAKPLVVPFCAIRSMAALSTHPGTDVWLASDLPCGPNPSGASARYAGPVGELSVRPVAGRTYLPSVRRGVSDEPTAPAP